MVEGMSERAESDCRLEQQRPRFDEGFSNAGTGGRVESHVRAIHGVKAALGQGDADIDDRCPSGCSAATCHATLGHSTQQVPQPQSTALTQDT